MKRTFPLWLGLLAFAVLPALAQTPASNKPTGKIHGHVTNSTGVTITEGSISLSTDGGHTSKYTFPVTASGDYAGEALPGTYSVIYRAPNTPPDKLVDEIDNVKIVAGQDVLQDDDMGRKEFIDKLSPEDRKHLAELKEKNAAIMKSNETVKVINADLRASVQDIHDAEHAHDAAVAALGASASKSDVDAKETEIKTSKYTDIETMMLKDTALRPEEPGLWFQLAQAQGLLKKYEDAEASYKKTVDLNAKSKKPRPDLEGMADAGLGEVYARNGKVPEANAAIDAAAKANPAGAGVYYKNEAVIFFNLGLGDAQVAAAEQAIKADATSSIPYYLKGQGLIQKATIDPKTGKMILPDGCAEAYQKYLALDPTGPYAGEVKAILLEASQTHMSSIETPKKKK